jgi:xanthine dehydrogenase accessory factor
VVAAEKGTPGNPGFAMAVALNSTVNGAEPEVSGTVGGGIMEKNLQEEAVNMLKSGQTLSFLRKLHHYKRPDGSVEESGLICSGSQTIGACTLLGEDLPTVKRIVTAIAESKPIRLQISQRGLATSSVSRSIPRFVLASAEEEDWQYSELLGAPDTVVIAGGGHVGLALSRQMALLGFCVVVADDRADVDTMRNNAFAKELHIASYQEFGEIVQRFLHRRVFVIIATAAYKTDVEALLSLSKTFTTPDKQRPEHIEYIGLMGSKAKITTIFRDLRLVGVPEAWLKTVSAPIGVQINSDTPEEIAVSIAAEIICVKNAR